MMYRQRCPHRSYLPIQHHLKKPLNQPLLHVLKRFCTYCLLLVLSVSGCRNDVDEFRAYDNTADELNQLLAGIPEASTITVFNLKYLEKDTVLSTPSGVRIFLIDTETLFATESGAPVPCSACSNLRIEVTEALRKRDVMGRGIPTMTTTGEVLDHAGSLRIQVWCGTQALRLQAGRALKIQLPKNAPLGDDFKLAYGATNANGQFTGFLLSPEPAFKADWVLTNSQQQTGYELYPAQLGWIGCVKPLDGTPNPFCVTLPAEYIPQNTLVFLIFESNGAVITLKPEGPVESRYCLDKAPVGFPVRIVALSKRDGSYWLGNRDTEIGTNATITVEPVSTPEAQIIALLKSL